MDFVESTGIETKRAHPGAMQPMRRAAKQEPNLAFDDLREQNVLFAASGGCWALTGVGRKARRGIRPRFVLAIKPQLASGSVSQGADQHDEHMFWSHSRRVLVSSSCDKRNVFKLHVR